MSHFQSWPRPGKSSKYQKVRQRRMVEEIHGLRPDGTWYGIQIPRGYRHLEMSWQIVWSATTQSILLRINGTSFDATPDTGANYTSQRVVASATTITGAESIATTTPALFVTTGTGSDFDFFSQGRVLFPYYENPNIQKVWISDHAIRRTNASAGLDVSKRGIAYLGLSPIFSLGINTFTAGNIDNGSKIIIRAFD